MFEKDVDEHNIFLLKYLNDNFSLKLQMDPDMLKGSFEKYMYNRSLNNPTVDRG